MLYLYLCSPVASKKTFPSESEKESKKLVLNRTEAETEQGIDPFGMENEFQPTQPILSQDDDDVDKLPDDLAWDISLLLNRKCCRTIQSVFRKHRKVFVRPEGKLGRAPKEFNMHIDANEKKIRSQRPYCTSPRKRRLVKEAIDTLQKLGVIQLSKSDIASPVVVVMQHGKACFCVDLREVNSKTVTDQYPLPWQDIIFSSFGFALFFSTIDINKGYHQIGVTEKSRRFTTFTTDGYGLWEFLCVPFGVKNAPAVVWVVVPVQN
jgi:hypothetical protein